MPTIHPIPAKAPSRARRAITRPASRSAAKARATPATQPPTPSLDDATHALQSGDFAGAIEHCAALITADPFNFRAHLIRATALFFLKQNANVIKTCDTLITLNPGFANSYRMRANALLQFGRHQEALADFDRLITIKPQDAEAHHGRATALRALERWAEALQSLDTAIACNHDCVAAHLGRAFVLDQFCDHKSAIKSYRRALALQPNFAIAHHGLGLALMALKRWQAAAKAFQTAITLAPDMADAHRQLGSARYAMGKNHLALASYQQSLALAPHSVSGHYLCGCVLQRLDRLPEAFAHFDEAVRLDPSDVEAHVSRAQVLLHLNRLDEAIACLDQILAIAPDHANAHVQKAVAMMLAGDFKGSWKHLEWRWKTAYHLSFSRDFPQPMWQGTEPLAGKTLFLYQEDFRGLGDSLQFCRYASALAGQGARVILEVQPPLVSLFKSLKGVSQIIARGDPVPDFDLHCPLMSLPAVMGTRPNTVPFPEKYLTSDPQKVAAWQARLGPKKLPRIGIAWSGNPTHENDRNRSLPLEELLRHLPAGCQIVSLQKEARGRDPATLARHPDVLHVGPEIHDFSDTAALCDCMDLIVSVDTSIAHLAGALGKKTWILLAHYPDCRWELHRSDTPWYANVTVWRQPSPGDWAGLFAQISAEG